MSKTFVLVNRDDQHYDNIKTDIVFVFEHINGKPDLAHIFKKLEEVLDTATDDDAVVFNGPSYLIALAGYVWLSREGRRTLNMYTYNVRTNGYELNHHLPYEVNNG